MVPPIPLGTLLRQRYLIQAVLGQGGFGRTYLALDQERFGERCVLKEFVVREQNEAAAQKSKKLFQREAAILHQLQHPQVPRFWAAFEDQQRLFLVQEFIPGKTYRAILSDRQKQQQALSEAEVRHFLKHMLPVLIYIHEKGILHRDISPDNVILSPQVGQPEQMGLPVLIDFGAVKEATVHGRPVSSVTRVGKIGYAPPEQLQTGAVSANSDLYALAATSVVLLTGKDPHKLLDGQTLSWSWQEYVTLDPTIAAILRRMLSVYPGDRYQSARDVWAELDPLLEQDMAATALQPSHANPIELLSVRAATSQHQLKTDRPIQSASSASLLPKSAKSEPPVNRKPGISWEQLRQGMGSSVRIVMAVVVLTGLGITGVEFWRSWSLSNHPDREVWIAGSKVSESDLPRLLTSPGSLPNAALKSGSWPGSEPIPQERLTSARPQVIQFPPNQVAVALQGNLQEGEIQPYWLKAGQGQILTVALEGQGVTLNLLRSNQQGIDAAAFQTRSWTGQIPADDQYTIQVAGSGSYSLDVAITPLSRPTQEQTQPVTFARGKNSTTVTGQIAPGQVRRYLLRANKGQLMVVKAAYGRVNLTAIAPNGQQIGSNTATSQNWQGRLPQDGDYAIEVTVDKASKYALTLEIF